MEKQIKSRVNITKSLLLFSVCPLSVLQSHDCLRSGPPDVGELIVVAMPNGQVVNASYIRSHTHIYYQVSSTPAAAVALECTSECSGGKGAFRKMGNEIVTLPFAPRSSFKTRAS